MNECERTAAAAVGSSDSCVCSPAAASETQAHSSALADRKLEISGHRGKHALVPVAVVSPAGSVLPILDSGSSAALRVCFLFFCPSR